MNKIFTIVALLSVGFSALGMHIDLSRDDWNRRYNPQSVTTVASNLGNTPMAMYPYSPQRDQAGNNPYNASHVRK